MPRRRMNVSRPISPILALKLVAMATSLELSEKHGQISNLKLIPSIWWKFGENRSRDNLSKRFILKKETTGCTMLPLFKFGVTGPKCTKFTHNIARSSSDELLKIRSHVAIHFGMPGLRIKVNCAILPILTLISVAMATSLEPSAKRSDR